MKRNIYYILSIAMIMIFVGSSAVLAQENTKKTYIQIRVDGLSCPFCAYGLEKKLKKVDGAANLHIELEDGLVSLDVPMDKKPTEASLKKVVTNAGFTPREIKFSDKPFKKDKDDNK